MLLPLALACATGCTNPHTLAHAPSSSTTDKADAKDRKLARLAGQCTSTTMSGYYKIETQNTSCDTTVFFVYNNIDCGYDLTVHPQSEVHIPYTGQYPGQLDVIRGGATVSASALEFPLKRKPAAIDFIPAHWPWVRTTRLTVAAEGCELIITKGTGEFDRVYFVQGKAITVYDESKNENTKFTGLTVGDYCNVNDEGPVPTAYPM